MKTHKEVDRAPQPVIGLVLQAGDATKFSQALGFESLDSFIQSQQAGSMSHSPRGGECVKRLVELEGDSSCPVICTVVTSTRQDPGHQNL